MTQATSIIKIYAYISAAWVQLDTLNGSRGRWGMTDNHPTTRLAEPGEISFVLDNSSGIYSPDGPFALAGWKKGIPLKMVITYDSADNEYLYKIASIKINPGQSEKSVEVTACDWLEDATNFPVRNPTLLENSTADVGITTMLATMPIQPASTNLDIGVYEFPTIFDAVRGNTKGYAELAKLTLSETGYTYLKRGGELVFEAADYRNGFRELSFVSRSTDDSGFLLKEDGGQILKEDGGGILLDQVTSVFIDNTMVGIDAPYGDNIINSWITSTFPKKVDTEAVKIYQLEKPIPIASGETKTIKVFFTNPVGGNPINALAPEADAYTKLLIRWNEPVGVQLTHDETGKTLNSTDVPVVSNVVKFGLGSGYFDATNSYIEVADSPDWDFGTGDFTVEWWEWRIAATANKTLFTRDAAAAFPAFNIGASDGTNLKVYLSSAGASYDIANGKTFGAFTLGAWMHYAITRSGTTFYMFKDGVQTDTWASAAALNPSSAVLTLGKHGANYLDAVVDEVRISKGIARYTSGFTPQTSEWQLSGVFAAAWTAANSTGTTFSESLTVTPIYGTEGATIDILNGSAYNGFITSIDIYGFGIYSNSSIDNLQEDAPSIEEYGYFTANLRQQYQQEQYSAILEGKKNVELNRQPRTILNSISLYANSSPSNMDAFLKTDIGNLIRAANDDLGVDGWCYVQGVEFEIKGGIIMFKWILKEAFTLAMGLSLMTCEFGGGVTTDAINYGHLPQTSQDAISHRGFSAWIYMDGVPSANSMVVMSQHSDDGGIIVRMTKSAGLMYLDFYNSLYAGGSVGAWLANSSTSTGAWHHIFVSQNTNANTTTDPVFFIDGASVTMFEYGTPTGAFDSDKGNPFIIGNWDTVTQSYNHPFDGKLKDIRVYDMDEQDLSPAALAAALYAEGAGGDDYLDGAVFQGPCVRDSDVTPFTNLTLTSDDKMLEVYLGNVGTPHGSPIARAM